MITRMTLITENPQKIICKSIIVTPYPKRQIWLTCTTLRKNHLLPMQAAEWKLECFSLFLIVQGLLKSQSLGKIFLKSLSKIPFPSLPKPGLSKKDLKIIYTSNTRSPACSVNNASGESRLLLALLFLLPFFSLSQREKQGDRDVAFCLLFPVGYFQNYESHKYIWPCILELQETGLHYMINELILSIFKCLL